MSVRLATFDDMASLLALMQEVHERSIYRDMGRIDEGQGHRAVFTALAAVREPAAPYATAIVVADGDDGLDGVLVGVLRPLYEILDVQVATDVLWYCRPSASARTAMALMKRFHEWAETWPGALVLRHGVHDAITDPERVAQVFKRQGFRRAGAIFEKEVRR